LWLGAIVQAAQHITAHHAPRPMPPRAGRWQPSAPRQWQRHQADDAAAVTPRVGCSASVLYLRACCAASVVFNFVVSHKVPRCKIAKEAWKLQNQHLQIHAHVLLCTFPHPGGSLTGCIWCDGVACHACVG